MPSHLPPLQRSAVLRPDTRRALGPLVSHLDDPELRDLLVLGGHGQAALWRDRGGGVEPVPGFALPAEAARELAVALIAAGGRHLDERNPCADVALDGGLRVHAVLPPIAVAGTVISIRVPRLVPLSFADLVRGGLCDPGTARWLTDAVRGRENLLISGATGTGKTTLLGALLGLVPRGERIISIEDVAELRIGHPHWVALEARQANTEGAGGISLEQLLREALRMRPDRIVLGECRGAEVLTLLSALNTGHDGGAGTLHASALADVPARLEALGALAGLGPEPLARQVIAALRVVVHLERGAAGNRIAAVGQLGIGASGALEVRA
ncbi:MULTISPECIES: CpaF family protein [unclassified Leucobacter]|uniref:CpaF family protein n=1 Tax=unclassified Leucobacter TaxID=2621730 RepID=UPI00165DD84C|nr:MULTISPECIES: ATPase, T2SS/T4P/T4SS family [unclassified Leucobacter]MBC9928249.1 Flp pilus assembly complex ATPase component TadA [Leucobacter sp. cx-169]